MKISQIDNRLIKIGGRTTKEREPLTLVWTGSYVEFNIKASEAKILISGPYDTFENWIAIEINGEVISRRMVNKEKEWVTLFRMMNPENPVRVRILKEVQAFETDTEHRLLIHEIETDGELLPVKDYKMKIEFIGDSINSAEGCIGAKCEMDWIAQFFSHTNSYPYMVGRELDADINVISQSGWGVYASWDCNCEHVLPKYYEEICSLMPKFFFDANGFYDKWDFSEWQPDAIIINLGTNDDFAFSNNDCDNADVLRLENGQYVEADRVKVWEAVINFLTMVRKNNPVADIYWAYGILANNLEGTIKEALEAYCKQSNDTKVTYIALPNTQEDEFGSRCHPGRKAHQKACEQIVNALK